MRIQIILVLILNFLICIPLIFSLDVGIGDDQIGIDLIPTPPINYSGVSTNYSLWSDFAQYWVTDEGNLNNVADILHSDLSNLAWSVAGHTIDSNIDMNSNTLTELQILVLSGGGYIGEWDGTLSSASHFNPYSDSYYALGSPTERWNNISVGGVFADGINSYFNNTLLIDGYGTGRDMDATLVIKADTNYDACINLTESTVAGVTICYDGAGSGIFEIRNFRTNDLYMDIDVRDSGNISFYNDTFFTNMVVENITVTDNITTNAFFVGDGSYITGIAEYDTNATTECGDDSYLRGDGTCQDLATTFYNATQSEAVAGTIDGGTLVDTQHPDGDYDGITFNFSEQAGAIGLDLRVNFTDVTDFNKGYMRYKTSSLSGDYAVVQLWSYDDNAWEGGYGEVSENTNEFYTLAGDVLDSSEHIGGEDGTTVQMRLYKSANGNTNNHYYVDMLAVVDGYATPSGNVDLTPYWRYDDNDEDRNFLTDGNVTANTYFGDWNGGNVDDDIVFKNGASISNPDNLYITESNGIRFVGDGNGLFFKDVEFRPLQSDTGLIDLGDELAKFKNLFLSGNVSVDGNINATGNITADWGFFKSLNISGQIIGPGSNFAQYQFLDNNFNGSGAFNTTSNGAFGGLTTRTQGKVIDNGDFSGGDTDWTVGSYWDTTGSIATFDGTTGQTGNLTSDYSVVAGKFYKIEFDLALAGGLKKVDITMGGVIVANFDYRNAGSQTLYIKALNTDPLTFAGTGHTPPPPFDLTIDNVVITEYGGIDAVAELSALFIENQIEVADNGKVNLLENTILNFGINDSISGLGSSSQIYADEDGKTHWKFASLTEPIAPEFLFSGEGACGAGIDCITMEIVQPSSDPQLIMDFEVLKLWDPNAWMRIGTTSYLTLKQTGDNSEITQTGGYTTFTPGSHLKVPANLWINVDGIGATFGVDSELEIGSDGTNPYYNATGSAVHTFYNGTGLGTIRVGSILYSSPENKDYSALDNLVNPTELTTDSKSELEFHQSFPEEIQTTIQVKDGDNCWEEYYYTSYCWNYTSKEGVINECSRFELENSISDYTANEIKDYKIIFYEEEITREECGTKDELTISGGDWDMFNYKGVWELKEENEILKTELCKLGSIKYKLEGYC